MSYPLTIENLSQIQRLLKNAQRLSRAVIYAESGSFEPRNAVGFEASTSPQPDIAAVRAAMAATSNLGQAAGVIIAAVSEYVQ